ncbi:MAG: hypothetical protein FWD24_07755 [Treponema sp.]|nr:hypothetical protein [Treponema sp.]
MTQQAELQRKIDKIPPKYFGEVIDFLGYIQHKAQQEANNIEQEERKVNIQKSSDGKLILTKEALDEMIKNSPLSKSLSGILHTDMTIEQIREERLARQLK